MAQCIRRRYTFFNHIIESDMVLPELTEVTEDEAEDLLPDVYIQFSTDHLEFTRTREWLHYWTAPDQSVTLSFARDDDTLFLHFPEMACFAISLNGRLVTCYAKAGLAPATVRHLLLDQVLPRLFAHFYSYIVSHASFLSINGKGVCFLADSGWGKSTMAAGLGTAGHTILTDDCLAISIENNQVIGIPAYHGIRLLPDSIKNLRYLFDNTGEPFAEYTSKKRISLIKPVYRDPGPLPMQALFLLTSPQEGKECTKAKIQSVGGLHGMKELLKNSFCLDVGDRQWQKEHFRRLSALATSGLPMFSMSYPREYEVLPEVVKTIMHTLDQL